MKRRELLKLFGIGTGALAIGGTAIACENNGRNTKKGKKVLRFIHMTDVHLPDDENIHKRFAKVIAQMKTHKPDFFLNGGDSIMAADYDNVTRESTTAQWAGWQKSMELLKEYEVYNCIGNHDMWWVPGEGDPMYGKDFVVKQLNMPKRYYSFKKANWYFLVLDGNLESGGPRMDAENKAWLNDELNKMPKGANVVTLDHYPIIDAAANFERGNHLDCEELVNLLYTHKDKNINHFSGHNHLLTSAEYNGVHYFNTGAVSGPWWGKGGDSSAEDYWYKQTPPGYSVVDLFEDGSIENTYIAHGIHNI